MSKKNNYGPKGKHQIPLVDLETHILPKIDNGAADLGEALDLLAMEQNDFVEAVALTPYFLPGKISLEEFLDRRNKACEELLIEADRADDIGIYIKKGAEVRLHPALLDINIDKLTIEGTPYILIELPKEDSEETDELLQDIIHAGYVPILTHVERYSYIVDSPVLLYDWNCMGALAMVSSGPVAEGGEKAKFSDQLIAWNLVQFMASDCHNLDIKPPSLGRGYEYLLESDALYLMENAANVYMGRPLNLDEPIEPILKGSKWK